MIGGLLAMVVANAGVSLGAASITRRIATGRRSLDALLFLLCRLLLISVTVIAAGLLRCLSPLVLGILGGVAVALWAACGEQRRSARPDFGGVGLPVALAAGLLVLKLLVQVWFFAPYSVDPLSYHLPKVATWIQQGALLPFPGADVRETYPAGFELLEAWWCVFLRHDALIEMAGVEFLCLGAAAVAALARYAGLGVRASAFAALLFVLTPALSLQATACMNDGAVAAVALSAFALLAWRARAGRIALALGLGASLKPTFFFIAPALLLLAILERKREPLPPPSRAGACTTSVLAAAAGLFWYARNLVAFGNPFYPLGSLGTVEQASPAAVMANTLLRRIGMLADSAILDSADHYTVQFILVAGWGVVALACGTTGLVVSLRTPSPLRRLASAFGLALLVALLVTPPSSFFLRFILFFPGILAIAAARLVESLPRLEPVVWVCASWSFLSALLPGDLRPSDVARLRGQSVAVRTRDPRFDIVPPDAGVACLHGTHNDSNGESYLAYGPGFTRRVSYVTRAESVDDLLGQLRTLGATWILAQARNGDGGLRRLVLEAAKQGRLRKEGESLFKVLGTP